MRCRLFAGIVAVCLAAFVGCGGSAETPPAVPAPGTSGQVPTDPIALVVYEFFDAVRQGQTAQAKQRLTPLALERITALNMNIAPPGSPTASFQVNGVTTRQQDHALVSLTWTDLNPDGKPYHEPILCEVKLSQGQWRICGMAQDQGPGKPPMVMDFESPEGMATPSRPPAAAQAGAIAGSASASASTGAAPMPPAREVAQDPFQPAPVQR